jgi:hypothetical protein
VTPYSAELAPSVENKVKVFAYAIGGI